MTEKEIEKRVKSALTLNAPAFPESLLEQCSEQEGKVNEVKRNHIVLKILIAAALTLALAATAAAAGLSNLIEPENALESAVKYVSEYETDPKLKAELANACGGLIYGEDLGTAKADLGLDSFRVVYNISFKTCGYSYKVVMDAKTGVVYSSERETDEEWQAKLPELEEESKNELQKLAEEQKKLEAEDEWELQNAPDYSFIKSRFYEHFGLSQIEVNAEAVCDYSSRKALCTAFFDGYVYSANVDFDSGEVSDESVAPDPDYQGKRVLHQKIEGLISLDKADETALKAVLEEYPDLAGGKLDNMNVTSIIKKDGGEYETVLNFEYFEDPEADPRGNFGDGIITVRLDSRDGSVTEITRNCGIEAVKQKAEEFAEEYGMSFTKSCADSGGECSFEDPATGRGLRVIIDPQTLEIVSYEEYKTTRSAGEREQNAELSGEAEEGCISEAAAAALALDDMELKLGDVYGLAAKIDENAYIVSFKFGLCDYPNSTELYENRYKIDKKTGEILSRDIIFSRFIGEDEAGDIAEKLMAQKYRFDDRNISTRERTVTVNAGDGYRYYDVRILTSGGDVYACRIDPLSGEQITL